MRAVKHVSVVDQAVENLKEYIMSGKIEVGDKLPSESNLSDQLSVGRGTVREAMRILQATGFVEMRSGVGWFVARTEEFDRDELIHWFEENEVELKDFIEVRAAIEPLATELAVARSSSQEVAELIDIMDQTRQAIADNNIPRIAQLDEDFHNQIVKSSKNKLLISISNQISAYLRVFRGKTFYIESNVNNLLEPHANIVNAFVNKDAEAGSRSMTEHLALVKMDLEKSKNPK